MCEISKLKFKKNIYEHSINNSNDIDYHLQSKAVMLQFVNSSNTL